MSVEIQRFDIPTRPTLIETFRAFRSHLEKIVEAKGRKLSPGWYDDGPERYPYLYEDQPNGLKQEPPPDDQPEANE